LKWVEEQVIAGFCWIMGYIFWVAGYWQESREYPNPGNSSINKFFLQAQELSGFFIPLYSDFFIIILLDKTNPYPKETNP
jgi:hypothetical protein